VVAACGGLCGADLVPICGSRASFCHAKTSSLARRNLMKSSISRSFSTPGEMNLSTRYHREPLRLLLLDLCAIKSPISHERGDFGERCDIMGCFVGTDSSGTQSGYLFREG
jgi:hypothetical protein